MLKLTKSFKRLRLLSFRLAQEKAEALGVSVDVTTIDHVIELSEEICFRVLFRWILTNKITDGANEVASHLWNEASCFLHKCEEFPFQHFQYLDAADALLAEFSSLLPASIARLELIGSLYEHIQNYPLTFNAGTDQCELNAVDRSARKLVGQFYTPPHIVDYCFEQAMKATDEVDQLHQRLKVNCAITDAGFRKIIDPSCGTGNFLIGALRRFIERNTVSVSNSALFDFVRSCLYGLDIDGRAIALCRISLIFELLIRSQHLLPENPSTTSSLESHLWSEPNFTLLLESLRAHIKTSDTLHEAANDLLSDSTAFNDVKRFDLVITNPPYVSFGARNQSKLGIGFSKFLKDKFPESADYKIRYYSIFQDIAVRFLSKGGVATLLVPDGFLTGGFYQRLRRFLVKNTRIYSISEFSPDAISGAVVGRWCVATYIRDDQTKEYMVHLHSLTKGKVYSYSLPREIFVSPDISRFRLLFTKTDENLCRQLDHLEPLSKLIRGHTGVRALYGQNSICNSERLSSFWQKGLRSGSAVTPHKIRWDGTWIRIETQFLYAGGFDKVVIESPKILVRQTGDRLTAAVDLTGFYHLNNIHSLSPANEHVNLDFIAGLLNSTLWLYIYRMKTRECGRALAQIDIETLESMPLPPGDQSLEDQIALLVTRIVGVDRDLEPDLFTEISDRLDQLVYEIYRLDECFVEHIELACGKIKGGSNSSLVPAED